MADRNEKMLAAVEKELAKNSGASATELMPMATKIDSSIKEMGARSFNASYVLPIKRKMSPPKKKTRKKATKKRGRQKKFNLQVVGHVACPEAAPETWAAS